MISEGGTSYGHGITVARAQSPFGPFESDPKNPILSHAQQPERPIQATGHGDLVQTPDAAWWMVLLGIRPSTPGHHHIGRETFLAPVTWDNEGWPAVNEWHGIDFEMPVLGLPKAHPWPTAPRREQLGSAGLGLHWSHVRNPDLTRYQALRGPDRLRLIGSPVSLDDVGSPTLIVQPQRDLEAQISTELNFTPEAGQVAGLVVRGNEANYCALLVRALGARRSQGSTNQSGMREVVLITRVQGVTTEVASQPVEPGPINLSVRGYLDRYEFSFASPSGKAVLLGEAPTSLYAYEKTGSFTGAFVGLYAYSTQAARPAVADFAWFEYEAR